MKKQYLIGLLGITAISIPMGTSLLNVTNTFSIEDPQTGIIIDNENSGVFVSDDGQGNKDEIGKGDKINALTIDATYDKTKNNDNIEIRKNDSLLIYYSDTEALEVSYSNIKNYSKYDSGEGFVKAADNSGIATYSATFDSENDKRLKLGDVSIWGHEIIDSSAYNLNTTVSLTTSERPTETEIGSIEIKPGFKASTISSSGEAEPSKNKNEAEIDYKVDLGKDIKGEDITIVDVVWIDNEITEGEDTIGAASTTYGDEIPAEGTITATDLGDYKTYKDTYLGAHLSDGSSTGMAQINPFTTWDQQTEVELEAGEVSTTEDSATLSYEISTIGTTHEGSDVTIEEVMWVTSEWSEDEPNNEDNILATDSKGKDKKLVANDLTTDSNSYEGTRIVAKTNDVENLYSDPEASSAQVDPFDIKYEVNESTIKESETKVSFVGDSDGIVSYEITPGNNDTNVESSVESIAWMDGDDTLAIDKDSPKLVGTLETTDGKLDVNTEYKNTTLVAQMDDQEDEIIADVTPFTTPKSEDQEQPELVVDTIETTTTNATIDFTVDYGINHNGNPYEIEKIVVEDENNGKYDDTTIIFPVEGETTGSIIINNLDSKTKYSNWKLQTTFKNTIDEENTETIETDLDPFTTLNNGLGIGAISGILVAVLIVIGFISGLLTYFSNKEKTKKEEITED